MPIDFDDQFDDQSEEGFDISNLSAYQGQKTQCDFCGKKFMYADVILFSATKNLVFCYPDDEAITQCLTQWVLKNGQAVYAEPVKFVC